MNNAASTSVCQGISIAAKDQIFSFVHVMLPSHSSTEFTNFNTHSEYILFSNRRGGRCIVLVDLWVSIVFKDVKKEKKNAKERGKSLIC
jgi:hypothetical protein